MNFSRALMLVIYLRSLAFSFFQDLVDPSFCMKLFFFLVICRRFLCEREPYSSDKYKQVLPQRLGTCGMFVLFAEVGLS